MPKPSQIAVRRFFVIAVICAILLVFGLTLIAQNMPRGKFAGEVIVPLDGQNGIAVTAAGRYTELEPIAASNRIYTNLSQERLDSLLPIQSRGKLESGERYDAIALPFEIEVEDIYTAEEDIAQNRVAVTHQGETTESEIAEGDALRLGINVFQIAEVRRWSGLFAHRSGEPMASIGFRVGEGLWNENVFLSTERWTYFEPDAAAKLVWCTSAEEAASLSKDSDSNHGTRWTVREGETLHSFEGTSPGNGIELKDGTEYTLADFRPESSSEPAAIAVHIKTGEEERVEVVEVNGESEDSVIAFEMPAARTNAFIVYAWIEQSGASYIVQDLRSDEMVSGVRGEIIPVPKRDYMIRLDDALPNAIPIFQQDSTVSEAILTDGKTVLRLRHAQPVQFGDYALEFRRTIVREDTDLLLVAHHRDAPSVTTFRLPIDATMRIMGWRLTVLPNPAPELDVFLLHAEYNPGIPLYAWAGVWMVVIFGGVLAVSIVLMQRIQDAGLPEDTL